MTRLRKEEFVKLLYRIYDIEETEKINLRLTSGCCGSFAVALKKVFGEGKLVAFSHHYTERELNDGSIDEGYAFGHVMLEIENKLYDGVGIHSYEKAKREWAGNWYDFFTEMELPIEKLVPSATRYYLPIEFFEKLLKRAAREVGLL